MSLDLIDHLPVVFTVDNVESNLFRQEATILNEAGPWAPFIQKLLGLYHDSGECSGMTWIWTHESINFSHPKKPQAGVCRMARWLLFKREENQIMVALAPYIYGRGDGFLHLDYRFTVATDDETLIPIMLLFREQILAT